MGKSVVIVRCFKNIANSRTEHSLRPESCAKGIGDSWFDAVYTVSGLGVPMICLVNSNRWSTTLFASNLQLFHLNSHILRKLSLPALGTETPGRQSRSAKTTKVFHSFAPLLNSIARIR